MGRLQQAGDLQELLNQITKTYRSQTGDGKPASYIPELATMDPDLFSIAATTKDGTICSSGDGTQLFSMQSISKVVALSFAVERFGAKTVFARVGMEPCAEPFNSIVKLELAPGIPLNPFINAGAITVSALIAERMKSEALESVLAFGGRMAAGATDGHETLHVSERIYRSEASTADRNRALAYFMHSTGTLAGDVEETLALYFRLCSIEINTTALSIIGATIAGGGVNPITRERVISTDTACVLLGLMSTCGLYNESGEFAVKVGIPAKSGVSGGILCSAPGKMGIAVFSPPLDAKGNSVAGIKALTYLSRKTGIRGIP